LVESEEERDFETPDRSDSERAADGSDYKTESPYHELLALSRVSAAVSELRDLDAIFEVALDTVLEVMNGTIGWILLVDEQTQSLSCKVLRGLSEKYAPEMHLEAGEGIAGRVAQTGKAVLFF